MSPADFMFWFWAAFGVLCLACAVYVVRASLREKDVKSIIALAFLALFAAPTWAQGIPANEAIDAARLQGALVAQDTFNALVLGASAQATPAVTMTATVEDGHVLGSDGMWYLGNVPYTRTRTLMSGGYYYRGRCCYQSPSYYAYSYARYYAPAKQATQAVFPTYVYKGWKDRLADFDSQVLDQKAYLAARQQSFASLGISEQSYGSQSYTKTYGGQTAFAYSQPYSLSQFSATYSGATPDLLFQQSARFLDSALDVFKQGSTEHRGLIQDERERQGRAAEILAKGLSIEKAANALNAAPSTTTVTTTAGVTNGVSNVPPPVPDGARLPPQGTGQVERMSDADFMAQIAVPSCQKCHTGAEARAKFEIKNYLLLNPAQKKIVRARLTTSDPKKHMPRDDKDQPVDLEPDKLKEFLTH
jgi:hypothetical protein